jgi:hypothetical protein
VRAIVRLVFWFVFLPMRIVRTAFKVGQIAACLISLLSLAAVVAVVLLVLSFLRGH